MPELLCYICKETSKIEEREIRRYYEVDCPRCDKYIIRDSSPQSLIGELSEQQIANISYWILHNQTADESPSIDTNNIDFLKSLRTPTVGEKAERFILYFLKRYPIPGTYIKQNISSPRFLSEIGCYNLKEVIYIVNRYSKENKHLIDGVGMDTNGLAAFSITPDGWAYIESLKDINPESQIGFVAMWFDDSVREVYENGISKGIEQAGYEPLRIDFKEHNNRIDDEIIATIKRCKFLVADLTGQRGGVYFEAGYALGLGLPVIWTCDTKHLKKVHFDTRQYYFITWDREKLSELRDKLRYRIEATIGRGNK